MPRRDVDECGADDFGRDTLGENDMHRQVINGRLPVGAIEQPDLLLRAGRPVADGARGITRRGAARRGGLEDGGEFGEGRDITEIAHADDDLQGATEVRGQLHESQ